jgi:outer membrane protein assembly factor BamE (lipoprotein component of BamABCDE complex)
MWGIRKGNYGDSDFVRMTNEGMTRLDVYASLTPSTKALSLRERLG